jgi:hypothetical protein
MCISNPTTTSATTLRECRRLDAMSPIRQTGGGDLLQQVRRTVDVPATNRSIRLAERSEPVWCAVLAAGMSCWSDCGEVWGDIRKPMVRGLRVLRPAAGRC